MEARKYDLMSVEDYLASEAAGEVRHEYLAGAVYAMSGGTRRHNRIALSIAGRLRERLAGRPCEVYLADVKLRVRSAAGEFFYYPDVMAGCDPGDRHEYYLERPVLLVEVTSPSTESVDRREKVIAYCGIPSLRHYLVVSQEAPTVEWMRRAGGGWETRRVEGLEGALEFPELGLSITLSEIYEGLDEE